MFEALVRRLGGTNQSIGRFLIACMVIGFASLIAAGLAAALATMRSQQFTDAVNHTYEVERTIARASLLIEQAETPRRGYIIAQQRLYLDNYRIAVRQLPGTLDRVAALTRDNPHQQANIARLRKLSDDLQVQRERTNALVTSGRADE